MSENERAAVAALDVLSLANSVRRYRKASMQAIARLIDEDTLIAGTMTALVSMIESFGPEQTNEVRQQMQSEDGEQMRPATRVLMMAEALHRQDHAAARELAAPMDRDDTAEGSLMALVCMVEVLGDQGLAKMRQALMQERSAR